jgi:hypothetical protein
MDISKLKDPLIVRSGTGVVFTPLGLDIIQPNIDDDKSQTANRSDTHDTNLFRP